jgi:hypothetical protein
MLNFSCYIIESEEVTNYRLVQKIGCPHSPKCFPNTSQNPKSHWFVKHWNTVYRNFHPCLLGDFLPPGLKVLECLLKQVVIDTMRGINCLLLPLLHDINPQPVDVGAALSPHGPQKALKVGTTQKLSPNLSHAVRHGQSFSLHHLKWGDGAFMSSPNTN